MAGERVAAVRCGGGSQENLFDFLMQRGLVPRGWDKLFLMFFHEHRLNVQCGEVTSSRTCVNWSIMEQGKETLVCTLWLHSRVETGKVYSYRNCKKAEIGYFPAWLGLSRKGKYQHALDTDAAHIAAQVKRSPVMRRFPRGAGQRCTRSMFSQAISRVSSSTAPDAASSGAKAYRVGMAPDICQMQTSFPVSS